jgi:hypothetical protein
MCVVCDFGGGQVRDSAFILSSILVHTSDAPLPATVQSWKGVIPLVTLKKKNLFLQGVWEKQQE